MGIAGWMTNFLCWKQAKIKWSSKGKLWGSRSENHSSREWDELIACRTSEKGEWSGVIIL